MTFHPLVSTFVLVVFLLIGLALVVRGDRGRGRTGRILTLARRSLMVVAVTAALAGPAIAVEEETVASNVEIVLAVDRTGSMAAEDGPGGARRLEAVQRDIQALVEGAASARFAVVTWDSSSRVELPVTTDSSAVIAFADNLHQEVSEFSTGSSLARPAATVQTLLESAAESRPQDLRYLVVFSDGESTDGSEGSVDALQDVGALIDGGAVLGYGTEQGGPMRIYGVGGVGSTEEYMRDEGGEIALSTIDEEALAGLADILDVPLLVNPAEEQVRELGASFVDGAGTVVEGRPALYTYAYITWIPALVFSALLVWEVAEFAATIVLLRRSRAL